MRSKPEVAPVPPPSRAMIAGSSLWRRVVCSNMNIRHRLYSIVTCKLPHRKHKIHLKTFSLQAMTAQTEQGERVKRRGGVGGWGLQIQTVKGRSVRTIVSTLLFCVAGSLNSCAFDCRRADFSGGGVGWGGMRSSSSNDSSSNSNSSSDVTTQTQMLANVSP